jgi:hypothetical protein
VGQDGPLADWSDNSADSEVLQLTGKADIHGALFVIIKSIQKYLSTSQSADSFLNLWIIGRSWTFRQITANIPLANAVVLATGKLGEYFRGCRGIFVMMYDHRFNASLRALEFI